MLNKILMGVVIALLIVAIVPPLATHVHQFEWELVTPATCITDGFETGRCKCGAKREHVITSTGHWYDNWSVTTAPTCQQDGEESQTCTKCGYTQTRTIVAKHNFENKSNCTVCGTEYFSQGIDFKTAVYGQYTVAVVTGIGQCTDIEVVIPAVWKNLPVVVIDDHAFDDANITSVTIPQTVQIIGDHAFQSSAITTVKFAPNSQLTKIGSYAFSCCQQLVSIDIPQSVKTIGSAAFDYCISLQQITIPSGVSVINTHTFTYCEGLQTITIPAKVWMIADNAFMSCTGLKSVIFESGSQLKSIEQTAFHACWSLQQITLPKTLTHIGPMAFSVCEALTSVTFEDPTGWSATYYSETISLDLSSPTQNAAYLAGIDSYANYTWNKK